MPTKKTQKSRPRSSSQPHNPTTMQSPNIWRLTESCHLRSKCVLPKFGTQRADTQPNIDGRGGVNPNLAASTVSTGVKPDVRATGIVVGKAVKVSTSIVTKVSQFSSRAVWACFSWLAATVTSTLAPKQNDLFRSQSNTHTSILKTLDCGWVNTRSIVSSWKPSRCTTKLAGKLCTVIDLLTRLPVQVWFHTNPLAHDTNFLICSISPLPRPCWFSTVGFTTLDFLRLIAKQVDFITRIKSMQRLKLSEFWVPTTRSETVWFQNRWQNQPLLRLRLVEVRQGKTMYGYITSVLDPQVLPPYAVADLYGRRWNWRRLSILLNACWD